MAEHPYHSLFSQSSFLGPKEHLYLAMVDAIEHMFIKHRGRQVLSYEEIPHVRAGGL